MKDHPMRWLLLFQSTLSVRRATILLAAIVDVMLFQSTLSVRRATFEPRVSRQLSQRFQSTLSVRRATLTHVSVTPIYQYFNPRSP